MDAWRKEKSVYESEFLSKLQYAVFALFTDDLASGQGIGSSSPQDVQSRCLDILGQTNTTQLYTFHIPALFCDDFWEWLNDFWEESQEEFKNRGLAKEVVFSDITFDHLNCQSCYPTWVERMNNGAEELLMPHSPNELDQYILELKSVQQEQPGLKVLILGSTPAKRSALFHYRRANVDFYYCIPYPY